MERDEVMDEYLSQERVNEVVGWCEFQAQACLGLGSPLWAHVSTAIAGEISRQTTLNRLVAKRPNLRFGEAFVLRLLGWVHREALSGNLPELANLLVSCGGAGTNEQVAAEVLRIIDQQPDQALAALDAQVQTNEVARANGIWAAIGGALGNEVKSQVVLIEIGCSAGLNLYLDRFCYTMDGTKFGDTNSPVCFDDVWEGNGRTHFEFPKVGARIGIDPYPYDLTDEAQISRLRGFIWPDQSARFERINGAIEIARKGEAQILQSFETSKTLREVLALHQGSPIVIFHSIMWQYVPLGDRSAILSVIANAGLKATSEAPILHVAFEPYPGELCAAINVWQHIGKENPVHQFVGRGDFHGRSVQLGGDRVNSSGGDCGDTDSDSGIKWLPC